MGVPTVNDKLFILFYADDQLVVAEDAEDLRYVARKLKELYDTVDMIFYRSKNEIRLKYECRRGSDIVQHGNEEDRRI